MNRKLNPTRVSKRKIVVEIDGKQLLVRDRGSNPRGGSPLRYLSGTTNYSISFNQNPSSSFDIYMLLLLVSLLKFRRNREKREREKE